MFTENTIRRMANNLGLRLRKLRNREDEYILVDVETSFLVYPWQYGLAGNGASLEEIQDYLED